MPVISPILVACGDDLGLHPAANEGIARAHEEGILRAAALMVTGEAVDEAVAYLRSHPQLSVGLHLSLLDTPPAGDPTPWAGLLDERGCFPPSGHPRSLARVTAHVLRHRKAAANEFAAQIRRARELGLETTHINGHNHLHLLPGLFPALARLCTEHGIRWIRVPRAPVSRLLRRRWAMDLGGVRGTLIRAVGRSAVPSVHPPLRSVDHVVGFGLRGPQATVAQSVQLASVLGPGITEWVVHPVVDDVDFRRRFDWGPGWGSELEALCHPDVAAAMDEHGVRLAGIGGMD